jgi:hypothetical protein
MVKKKKTTISIRTQLLVATGTVLLLTAFGLFVGWLDTSMDWHLGSSKTSVSLSDVTLKGESTCLEHKGKGPHDMMCAIGIKTASGAVYAIKGDAVPAADNSLEVTGTLTSASKNEKYDIAGTLTVK